jgi:hypothetical protein
MTPQGTVVALLGIAALILLVVRLTIKGRLYAGYSVIWLACLSAGALLLVVPRLLQVVTVAVGAVFPVSAVTLLSLIFIFLVLIYLSCQLTILSDRVTALAQSVALRDVVGPPDSPSPERPREPLA